MKKIILLSLVLCLSLIGVTQELRIKKGIKIGRSETVVDTTALKSLQGVVGNIQNQINSKVDTTFANANFVAKGDSTLGYSAAQVDSIVQAKVDSASATNQFVRDLSLMKGFPGGHFPVGAYNESGGFTMVDNRLQAVTFVFPVEKTIYGVYYQLTTNGAYTPDGENGVILAKLNNTANTSADTITGTKVLSPTAWSVGTGVRLLEFDTPIVIAAGSEIKAGILYNNSAQTTAPVLARWGGNVNNAGLFEGLNGIVTRTDAITNFPATINLAATSESTIPRIWLKDRP